MIALTLYKEKLVIKTMNTVTSLIMEIFTTRIIYFYQNLILLITPNGNMLDYFKRFEQTEISVGGIFP